MAPIVWNYEDGIDLLCKTLGVITALPVTAVNLFITGDAEVNMELLTNDTSHGCPLESEKTHQIESSGSDPAESQDPHHFLPHHEVVTQMYSAQKPRYLTFYHV